MDLQRGYCALCSSNTKVVVPPQATTIINNLKKLLAEQINVKEFSSINSTLRVCAICLHNILTIKTLSRKFQRHISPDSDSCCLCEEDENLVAISDHNYLKLLLDDTKYEETVSDCLMCLDCIKCLDLMRNIRLNLLKRHTQLAQSSPVAKASKSPNKSPVSKRSGRVSKSKTFLSHLKPASRTRFNLQRFKKDFTLLHKICYIKLDNVDLLYLKRTYKPERKGGRTRTSDPPILEDRRSKRKSLSPRKDYKRMLSPSSEDETLSPPQNFFKIKMKQTRSRNETEEKWKITSPSRRIPPRVTSPRVTSPRVTSPRVTSPRVPSPRVTSPRVTSPRATSRRGRPKKVERQRDSKVTVKDKKFKSEVKPRRIRSRTHNDSIDDKKLIVNVSRLSVDEDEKKENVQVEDEDDEPLIVIEKDPLSISDDEDKNSLKTPTKAERKRMPDSNSSKKRKSVTFAEEKNVEFEYGEFEPKVSVDNTLISKSSLKKSTVNIDSDEEEVIEYLEHVRNNVDDVFNSLKSSESIKPINETVSNITSTVVSSDDIDNDNGKQTQEDALDTMQDESNTEESNDQNIENTKEDDETSTKSDDEKRQRCPSPEQMESVQDTNENDATTNEQDENTVKDIDATSSRFGEKRKRSLSPDQLQNNTENKDVENEERKVKKFKLITDNDDISDTDCQNESANEQEIQEAPIDPQEAGTGCDEINIDDTNKADKVSDNENESIGNEQEQSNDDNSGEIASSEQEVENQDENMQKISEEGINTDLNDEEQDKENYISDPAENTENDLNDELQSEHVQENTENTDLNEDLEEKENNVNEPAEMKENESESQEENTSELTESAANGLEWRSDYENKDGQENEDDEGLNNFKTVDSCSNSVNGDEQKQDFENQDDAVYENNQSLDYGAKKCNGNSEVLTQSAHN